MVARFKQEIQLSRKIGHPNVCRMFDLARHPADGSAPDPVYFLTMELVPGETLAALLDAGVPAEPVLADFVAAIRDDRAPAVDGREGRRAVALIEAIYRSAATGRSTAVDGV